MKKITIEFFVTILATFAVVLPIIAFYHYTPIHWLFYTVVWLTSITITNNISRRFDKLDDKCKDNKCKKDGES